VSVHVPTNEIIQTYNIKLKYNKKQYETMNTCIIMCASCI